MSTTAIARRYAKALYELAVENAEVDAIADDLATLSQAVRETGIEVLQPGSLSAEVRSGASGM